MPYSLKITRNTKTQEIKVHPVTPCPFALEPGKRYPSRNIVETVQIFDTQEAAESARAAELVAVRFASLDRETLQETLRSDIDRVANFGWSIADLCRIGNLKYKTVITHSYNLWTPNPRLYAKIHLIADALENVAKFARAVLPPEGEPGAMIKGRRGRKDIYRSSPNWIESRGKIQS